MIEEVVFFTIGDSNDISTFSGVPFFFSKELERRGIIVNRVDLSPPHFVVRWYNRIVKRLALMFNRQSTYDFSRSIWFDLYKRWRVREANKLFPKSDCSIFITYSAHNNKSNHINILFGDWTLQYWLEDHKVVDWGEKVYVQRENKYISKADIVISLFPLSAEYIKSKVPDANVVHLGQNVINDFNKESLSETQILEKKAGRRKILFIGRGYYIDGFLMLLNAFDQLREDFKDLELNVIGLTDSEVLSVAGNIPDGVKFHGFLRKDIPSECKLYYELLNEASLFVNPNPKWAGYTSMIEAMYYYTPIITSPYDEFVNEFGSDISFGKYLQNGESLAMKIRSVLEEKEETYINKCITAHKCVEDYTWNHYVDALMEQINQFGK